MKTPPPDAGVRQQVAYLVERLDEHLDEHSRDLKEALAAVRRAQLDRAMLFFTALAAIASLVTMLAMHTH